MTLRTESLITLKEGESVIPPWFREADNGRIYASVLTVGDGGYQNFRLYSPRSFYGYIQFFDGEAVERTLPLEFPSQKVYARDECCIAAMEDRCRKYSCLALKLDWIGQLLTLAFPPIAAGIGFYPFTSDAANFGDDLILDIPTSIAWNWEPDVTVLVEFVADVPQLSNCNPPIAYLPSPEGCRNPGQPVPKPGACIPTVPSGGGGSN